MDPKAQQEAQILERLQALPSVIASAQRRLRITAFCWQLTTAIWASRAPGIPARLMAIIAALNVCYTLYMIWYEG